MKKLTVGICCLVLVLSLTGCLGQPKAGTIIETYPLEGHFDQVTWLPDGSFVIAKKDFTIWLLNRDNGETSRIALPDDSNCRITRYLHPSLLPDGRLGVVKVCLGRWPEKPPGADSDESYLLAVDLPTVGIEQIVPGPLPSTLSGAYSWNPDMSRGIQLVTNGLNGALYWITSAGTESITSTVSDGSQSWSLDVDAGRVTRQDLGEVILVGDADWSPDGSQIAFWASPDSVRSSGMSRSSGEWQLYLMDHAQLLPNPVLGAVYSPFRLAWSPDSKHLAFFARQGIFRTPGLWLFTPSTGETNLIYQFSHYGSSSLDWSSDGQQIATIYCPDFDCHARELRIIDLSAFIDD